MRLERVYPSLESAVHAILLALMNRLTFTENIQSVPVSVPDTGLADVEFEVRHALGKTPRHYIYNVDRDAVVYDSRRSAWSPEVMYLKCSTANTRVTLTIL